MTDDALVTSTITRQMAATEEWPNKTLKPAGEAAEALHLSKERLLSLAEGGLAPHWRIDNGPPLFHIPELKKWVGRNLMTRYEGEDMQVELRAVQLPPAAGDVPQELAMVGGLREIPALDTVCGVYFLCDENSNILYIGQSIAPLSRLGQHRSRGRVFARAFLLPAPKAELDRIEGALIRHFNPPLNGVGGTPSDNGEDGRTIRELLGA